MVLDFKSRAIRRVVGYQIKNVFRNLVETKRHFKCKKITKMAEEQVRIKIL